LPKTIPTFSIPRPSKIYPNFGFLVWKYTIWQPCPAIVWLKSLLTISFVVLSRAFDWMCWKMAAALSANQTLKNRECVSGSSIRTAFALVIYSCKCIFWYCIPGRLLSSLHLRTQKMNICTYKNVWTWMYVHVKNVCTCKICTYM
jgi:hypothetical protein